MGIVVKGVLGAGALAVAAVFALGAAGLPAGDPRLHRSLTPMVDVAYGARDALPLPTPPRWPVVSPVAACEEDIDRHVALAAYMRSKLRLQGAQTEAWRRIEDAAVPALEALRSLCGEFPDPRASDRPIVEAISYGEKRLVAAAALLRAIREPARALYEMLSPDQRAALAPPAPPVRRHLPPGPPPLLGPPPM